MDDSHAHSAAPPDTDKRSRALAFGDALIRHAVHWIDEKRYVERHRRYIEDLDRRGELDGLLEAMGLTRAQLDAFALSPLASAELLTGVMARIGLADSELEPSADAGDTPEMRCRTCTNWRLCRRWLERGATDDGYREFCPNAVLLDRLRQRVQSSASASAGERG